MLIIHCILLYYYETHPCFINQGWKVTDYISSCVHCCTQIHFKSTSATIYFREKCCSLSATILQRQQPCSANRGRC